MGRAFGSCRARSSAGFSCGAAVPAPIPDFLPLSGVFGTTSGCFSFVPRPGAAPGKGGDGGTSSKNPPQIHDGSRKKIPLGDSWRSHGFPWMPGSVQGWTGFGATWDRGRWLWMGFEILPNPHSRIPGFHGSNHNPHLLHGGFSKFFQGHSVPWESPAGRERNWESCSSQPSLQNLGK